MNVGRSLRVALAKNDRRLNWVAEQLSISQTQVGRFANSKSATGTTIAKLSALFGMKASEFIALGETEEVE